LAKHDDGIRREREAVQGRRTGLEVQRKVQPESSQLNVSGVFVEENHVDLLQQIMWIINEWLAYQSMAATLPR